VVRHNYAPASPTHIQLARHCADRGFAKDDSIGPRQTPLRQLTATRGELSATRRQVKLDTSRDVAVTELGTGTRIAPPIRDAAVWTHQSCLAGFSGPTSVRYGENASDGTRLLPRFEFLVPFSWNIDAAKDGDRDRIVGAGGNFPAESVALQFLGAHLSGFVLVRKGCAINLQGDFTGCRVDALGAEQAVRATGREGG
jgi:hypothetical protein